MTEVTIDKIILGEIKDFQNKDIVIVEGFNFNQIETIKNIYLKYNSRFKDGQIDTDGNRKYFFNINKNPCKVTSKAIDFDTKDINIQTASGGDQLKTWYFERDLKFWMKDQGFGKVLNRIFSELPIFGSVVLKVIEGKPYFVDLRNFVVEQSADSLEQANYVTEVHHYTPREYKKWADKFGWNNTEKIMELHSETKKPYITVFERYGEDLDGKYKRIFAASIGSKKRDEFTDYGTEKAEVIKTDIVENHPYWEFHLEKISGRWLGVGIVEVLLDPQVRQNELANQLAKATYYASLHVWQSQDPEVNVNIQSEVKSGQILTSDFPISPIDMTERNLSYFAQEVNKWITNRDELTFSYDVVQGERLPAGTPLGSAQLAATMAGSYFDQIRENIGLDIKEFLYKVIIPQFKKENKSEHILRLVGEDLETVRNMMINQKANNSLFEFLARNKKFPTQDQYDIMKTAISERVNQGKEQLIDIPDKFYDNIKYKIDIIITGEQKDTRVTSATKQAILQAITVDPTILQDPARRKLLFSMAEDAGINMNDFVPTEQPSVEGLAERIAPKQGGGGVSKPAIPVVPTQGKTEATL